MKYIINPGDKFNKLTVISELPRRILPSGQKPRDFKCRCECGKEVNVLLVHLTKSKIQSCGCSYKTANGESATKLHKRWRSMIRRCYGNTERKHRYNQRGITVCDEWRNDFFTFKKWAIENGYDDRLQIDRIDNNGNYEPSNCRWVPNIINVNNREETLFIDYHNDKIPFMELLRKKNLSMHEGAIRRRIKRGWAGQTAFDIPITQGNYKRK